MGEISDIFESKIVNFYCMSPLGEMTSSISLFYELIVKAGLPASFGLCPLLHSLSRFSSWYQTLSSGSRRITKIHIQVECIFDVLWRMSVSTEPYANAFRARSIIEYSLMEVEASLSNARRLGIRILSFIILFNCLFWFCEMHQGSQWYYSFGFT